MSSAVYTSTEVLSGKILTELKKIGQALYKYYYVYYKWAYACKPCKTGTKVIKMKYNTKTEKTIKLNNRVY